jgi:hypothetical protein
MTGQGGFSMRRLTPSYIATSVAIALASTAALAQLQIQTVSPGTNATAPAPTGTATAPGNTFSGACAGTGGSTCTATTTNAPTSAGPTGNAAPSETSSGNVTAPASSNASTPVAASSGASPSRPFTPDFVNNAAADAPFRTTPNTPDATPTGAALGQSPGQTSSGTAAGNSSSGIDAGSQNLGTVNPSGTNLGNTALVPGVAVGATTGVVGTAGVNANGQRVGVVVAEEATPPTPLFELTARQGAEREARRRARGEEPRVYGIAPRTDRDLTHQMPDDPIIRY